MLQGILYEGNTGLFYFLKSTLLQIYFCLVERTEPYLTYLHYFGCFETYFIVSICGQMKFNILYEILTFSGNL